MINYEKFVKGSRNFLKKYIIDNRLESCVLGISGGIDSTVSACIASPVCRELSIPLIGRSLPTTTNKIEESKVAQLVGDAFCDDFKTVNISEECQKLIHELELVEGEMTRLQEGNVKARVRMIYLRHLASIHKGVVLDNDNFTEWNLGFFTLHGDQGDVNLGIHYLWKTRIYVLAKYLIEDYTNQAVNIYPSDIEKENTLNEKVQAISASMRLTPTDGNGVTAGGDCEQFGLENYEQVDDVLKTMFYTDYSVYPEVKDEEYIRLIKSYNKQGVDKVIALHQNTEYKRKELSIKPTKEELGL